MYKSPIDIIQGQLQLDLENGVYKAIQKVDINVDREELIKALQYDRNQYDKGYSDGMKETAEKFAEMLKAEYDAIGKKLQQSYEDVFGSDLPEWSVPDVLYSYGYIDKIDEICKEITEGKNG